MAFCVCAMSLSTVSCTKEIEADIANLKEQVADLAKKLADLEARLTSEVNAINTAVAAVEAKVAVVNVESKDGNVTLTLANGDKVTVAVPDANANNTGLITTVTENGKNYWAVVGADGKAQSLGIEVGHLAVKLSFKVDPETKELLVSYDGKEYEGTGVLVKDPDEYDHIISAFEEGEDYVTFTIGEATYTLPKYVEDNASLVIGRTDFFLRYEGVKEVELTVEGIADYYVMNEPDGWKATIEGNILTVTAPTKKAIEIGAAEKEGLVLVHATTDQGKCKVAKVEVKAGPGLTLAVDYKGNVTLENSFYGASTTHLDEEVFGFSEVIFGLATPEIFNADPAAYVQVYNDTWYAPNEDICFPDIYNFADMGMYVEGEYETDIVKTTVNDAYSQFMYEDVPVGTHLVVWAAPADDKGKAIISDMVYVDYVAIEHEVEVTSVSHNDVTISATVAGAESYIIGYVNESDYNNEYTSNTFEDYMMSMGGPWHALENYGSSMSLGIEIPEVPAEFNLSDIFGEKLAYGANYKVWIMPIHSHLRVLDEAESMPEYDYYAYDYSAFKFDEHLMPYVFDVKTNDIVAGGAYNATLEMTANDYASITVDVTVPEGTEAIYYYWYDADEYAEFANDAAVMADLLENCYNPMEASGSLKKSYANPGETYVLATFAVGFDGKYGEIVAETFSTRSIPYSESITAELVSCEPTLKEDGTTASYTVVVNVTGATKVMGYNISASADNLASFYTNLCKNGHKTSYYGYQMANVENGQATLTFNHSGYKTDYYVLAYNVENNLVSAVAAEPVVVHLFDKE